MLLGFDIGGTKCAAIIGNLVPDHQIKIIDKVIIPTDLPVYQMIDLLFSAAEKLLADNHLAIDQIDGIGINCGGPLNSREGIVLSPPNLPGWDHVPIVEMTEKRFGKNAFLQNDANAGAVAEWKYGAGKGYNNLIFLTFGTGMGAGLILDGKLYAGTSDLAGEVGHIRLSETGPVGFGKAGSFEGYCSGGGIAQLAQMKAREKLQMGAQVTFCRNLHELTQITAKSVAEAAFKGDSTAIDVYETCAVHLGRALSLLMDILNPELIILGGIYGRAKPLLEPMMMTTIRTEAIDVSRRACRIVPADLSENIGDMSALSLALSGSESHKYK